MTKNILITPLLLVFICQLIPSYSIPSSYGPPEDGFDWIDNKLMPQPEEGSRWWYTPSRKAHLHENKYRKRLEHDLKMMSKVGEDLRLPTNILPSIYHIQLLPFIEEGNFTTDGSIEIFVDCATATRNITMNSVDITIDLNSITVTDLLAESNLQIEKFFDEQIAREMFTIQLVNELEVGKQYRISIKFISLLRTDFLAGFYISSYIENGVKKYLAVTDMEAPDARRAYPCFDEPNMKAQFTITLGRKTTMKTASNMRILKTTEIAGLPGYVWDQYETSLKMSTYLVAFLVSEFVPVPLNTPGLNRVPFRLWTRPEFAGQAEYALNRAAREQQFFENFFEVQYPMPKQDSIAVPDFSSGAMENWGLITYREAYLLVNSSTPRTSYQTIAAVNAHELAHQWFGDLVTIEWWNTLWLNEGFASYFEWLDTNSVEPDWKMMDQYITGDLQYVFGPDSLETSRPIVTEVTTNPEIRSMFDSISYEKGGCMLRMMSDFLGEETFRLGIKRYIESRSFSNAVQDDLWDALQEQARVDGVTLPATMKEIMDTWTLRMGYPVITVTRSYSENTAVVTQERFLSKKSEGSTDPNVYQWWVPLSHRNQNMVRATQWLSANEKSKTITISGAVSNKWVLFNVDQYNYYRVAYDTRNYEMLAAGLIANHDSFSVKTRGQLLDDAFNLALANMIPYKAALDFSLFLEQERDYVPWRAVLTELDFMDIMLYNSSISTEWRNHLTKLVLPYYKSVGFLENPGDSHLRVYSRTDANNWACRLEIPDCVNSALTLYASLMANPNMVFTPNQGRSFVIRSAVEYGSQLEWDFAFDQYKATRDTTYLTAMTYTRQLNLIEDLLDLMLQATGNTSDIRLSDVNILFTTLATTPIGYEIAFDFLINRWDAIEAALGPSYFVSFYYSLRSRLNTQEELDKYIKLQEAHSGILSLTDVNVRSGIETVQSNVQWMNLHLTEIETWLKNAAAPTFPPEPATPAPAAANIIRHQSWIMLIVTFSLWILL